MASVAHGKRESLPLSTRLEFGFWRFDVMATGQQSIRCLDRWAATPEMRQGAAAEVRSFSVYRSRISALIHGPAAMLTSKIT
jgi:hypothetical protein